MFSQHEIGNYSKFRKGKIRNFAVTPVAIVPRVEAQPRKQDYNTPVHLFSLTWP